MAGNKENISSAKKGMNRDTHPSQLPADAYTFMLNGNIEHEEGSFTQLQNEHSNILCSMFKDGYKVIGHKVDIKNDKVYFFLTNPETGLSEIGQIANITCLDNIDAVEVNCNCDIKVVLGEPLEEQDQLPTCNYETLIEDCEENKCLNFSVCHTFKSDSIQLKQEKCGDTLYFTDNFNPPRYLQLDNLDIYSIEGQPSDCITSEETCLDCAKLRIFPEFEKPCLEVETIRAGGNLTAGVYQVIIAYSDASGNELSQYYAITNNIPIFDLGNNILSQSTLDYKTNLAIKLNAIDLDDSYAYYKVAVIRREGLEGGTSYRELGVFSVNNDSIIITDIDDLQAITLEAILAKRAVYERAKGMTSGNGILFQYGLESKPEINLQPIVNLLGHFAKWTTVRAKEDLYKDGANVANFKGYMRDEVYPFGIKFFLSNGFETAVFPFIPKPKTLEDAELIEDISAATAASMEACSPNCAATDRLEKWQLYNTANVIGTCPGADGGEVVVETEVRTCSPTEGDGSVSIVDDMTSGYLIIPEGSSVSTITDFINQNIANIINPTSELSLINATNPNYPDLVEIVDDSDNDYAGFTCDPFEGSDCTGIAEIEREILALSVEGEEITPESKPTSEYEELPVTGLCTKYQIPATNDAAFVALYLEPTDTVTLTNTNSNTTCATASPDGEIPQDSGTSTQNPVFLEYKGEEIFANTHDSNYSGLEDQGTALEAPWLEHPHNNATWHTGDFYANDQVALRISSQTTCENIDSMNISTEVRVSIFDSCAPSTAISSQIIDITTHNTIILNRTDFSSNQFFVVLDSPIKHEVTFTLTVEKPSVFATVTGTSGDGNIIINGNPYSIIFDTDLTTTISNFEITHGATILATEGLTVVGGTSVIIFEGTTTVGTITYTQAVADLDVTFQNSELDLDIDGNIFTMTFDTDLNTTVSNFLAANQPAIEALVISVSSVDNEIYIKSTVDVYNNTTATNTIPTLSATKTKVRDVYLTQPNCSCFNMVHTLVEATATRAEFDTLNFFKRIKYEAECTNIIPSYNGCEPAPNEYGNFAYWESENLYPCNDELYNSSNLIINQSKFSGLGALQTEFEEYFGATTDIDNNYELDPLVTDFKDKPIRHYKFPCSAIKPFMETSNNNLLGETFIYPIGFTLDNDAINLFLDIAVDNNLISVEDRAKITKYEIVRGDRSTDRSVVAKGLMYDMYKYQENGKDVYYPNFPYNDLGKDVLHNIDHPFNGTAHSKYTFHSPTTHYSRPVLGTEMKIEGYQFGQSEGRFSAVEDHPTWVIMGQAAYTMATTLAIAEVAFELLVIGSEIGVNATTGHAITTAVGIALAVVAVIAIGVAATIKVGQRRLEWLQIFKNFGNPNNFAYFYSSYGMYNRFLPNADVTNMHRGLCTSRYLTSGRWTVTDEIINDITSINNVDREKSVFLSTGGHLISYPPEYRNNDNTNTSTGSRYLSSDVGCEDSTEIRNISSPYVSIKNYLPSQYGKVSTIRWKDTGYCGKLSDANTCEGVFGGDIFISRFSWKRKMPMFLADAMGVAPLTPFKYSTYNNIPSLKYHVDYELSDDGNTSILDYFFPDNRTDASADNMDCFDEGDGFYVKPPAKFYLSYYGIPYFLVESEENCWLRYGKTERHERFYPQESDYVGWTQENTVSIREPNTFFYNPVYSINKFSLGSRTLVDTFKMSDEICKAKFPNGLIYSEPDFNESDRFDPWLVFKPLNFNELPTSYGNLIDLRFIESNQLLGRFENQIVLYNRINDYLDGTTAQNSETGTGSLFKVRPIEFNSTDLGYAGTQHTAMVSCEHGHFWADAKRGQVFKLNPGGKGLNEITAGVRNWFKEHLPFKILKSNIQGISQEDVDNNYNGLGIAMVWDNRYRRVILTKKDYKLKEGCSNSIEFRDCKFYDTSGEEDVEILLQDETYFENCSFTIAYSPLSQTWISYYSFLPDYYIGHIDYFQSGVNRSKDSGEVGLWSHLLTNQSYQVFYGKLYPWIIETPLVNQTTDSIFHNVHYWLDVRAYTNEYDFAERLDLGFNTAHVYNNSATSGKLNLIREIPNNLRHKLDYPKYNTDSIDILATSKYKKWSFNSAYNICTTTNNNVPLWINDCNQILKSVNPSAIKYKNTWKNRLQGDWFLTRLEQNEESQFKFIFKWQSDKRNLFNG